MLVLHAYCGARVDGGPLAAGSIPASGPRPVPFGTSLYMRLRPIGVALRSYLNDSCDVLSITHRKQADLVISHDSSGISTLVSSGIMKGFLVMMSRTLIVPPFQLSLLRASPRNDGRPCLKECGNPTDAV